MAAINTFAYGLLGDEQVLGRWGRADIALHVGDG